MAISNMADVDEDKMSIMLPTPVTQFTMSTQRFMMQGNDGSGVFFYWYNQLSNGFSKGAIQFMLNDTATNRLLDYQEDHGATERDKQLLARIKRQGGSHELVGGFKVEVLHPSIKECYDKLVRYFEKIEEPINLPDSDGPGGLDDAVYEGSDGNQSDSEGDVYGDDHQLFIDPKLLGDKEKLKPVPAGANFMGFDFDSAVGGKGFADLFGGQPKQPQVKGHVARKNSFEDLLNIMDGEGRDPSKERIPVNVPVSAPKQDPIKKMTLANATNPFADDFVVPTSKINPSQHSNAYSGGIGLSNLGISTIESKATAQNQVISGVGRNHNQSGQAASIQYAQQHQVFQKPISHTASGVSQVSRPVQQFGPSPNQYSFQQQALRVNDDRKTTAQSTVVYTQGETNVLQSQPYQTTLGTQQPWAQPYQFGQQAKLQAAQLPNQVTEDRWPSQLRAPGGAIPQQSTPHQPYQQQPLQQLGSHPAYQQYQQQQYQQQQQQPAYQQQQPTRQAPQQPYQPQQPTHPNPFADPPSHPRRL